MIEISEPLSLPVKPVVSILMLAYNHEEFLAQAIEGVLAQECDFPIELIVAEDCSVDRTLEIARYYQRTYPGVVRIVSGEANVGMMRNFYRGLSRCRGEFIAFCEGDDWWINPRKLEIQTAVMRGDPSIGLVHGNFVNSIYLDGKWVLQKNGVHDGKNMDLLSGNLFGVLQKKLETRTCTILCRKAILSEFERSKLGNPMYVAGDLPMALYFSSRSTIGYVPEVVSVYRISPNSATRSGFPAMVRFLEGVARIYDDVKSLYGARKDFDPRASLWVHVALAKVAFRANDRVAFDRAISRAIELQNNHPLEVGIRLRGVLMKFPLLARIANRIIDIFQAFRRTGPVPSQAIVVDAKGAFNV